MGTTFNVIRPPRAALRRALDRCASAHRLRAWSMGAALALLASAVAAQTTGGIAGQIVDATRSDPVAGAIVVVKSPSLTNERGVQTNAEGKFSFEDLPGGGKYRLDILPWDDYEPKTLIDIVVEPGRTLSVGTLRLSRTSDPETLPLAGSKWQDLAIVAPGTANGDSFGVFDPCATRVGAVEVRDRHLSPARRDWALIAILCPPSVYAGWRGQSLKRYSIDGQALGSGNFNGDGYADLAVVKGSELSIWGVGPGAQAPVKLQSIPLQTSYQSIEDPEPGGTFADAAGLPIWAGADGEATTVQLGAVLVSGLRNADGYDDLLVGLPEAKVGSAAKAGVVLEFLGSKTGLQSKPVRIYRRGAPGLTGSPTANDRFGSQVALIDFDRKGIQNLLIGCPYCYAGTGAFWAERADRTFFGQTIGGGNLPGSHFGWAFTAADLDGDAYRDFVVGAPGLDAGSLKNAGAIYAYGGGATTPTYRGAVAAPAAQLAQTTPLGFGAALEAFDAVGAGTDQIFVGAPCMDLTGKKDAGGVVPVTLFGAVYAPFHLDRGAIPGEAHAQEYLSLPNRASLLTRPSTLTALCAGN